ncbi:MAG: DNA recombination protein RmuC [Candidatus Omnitrophica bacterium]|nr:DNA recombination protein RmuC [Candidatus Omnitrophota bacterium]
MSLYIIIALIANGILLTILLIFGVRRRPDSKIYLEELEKSQERLERLVKDEITRNRKEISDTGQQSRKEIIDILSLLTQGNEQKIEKMRETIHNSIKDLQNENSQKLDQMRSVVDEKLHATLEKRLGEQFKLVSSQLESVHKGLGEMQNLASSVGDLKKVLTNVKTRGTWGEIQLGSLLEQMLTPQQYETNVATKPGSRDRVEFAIKLPGQDHDSNKPLWLPIDAKFPQEDYQQLQQAQESANADAAEKAARQLELRIKAEAKSIKEKYIDPPHTTDFAIMFLPIEGLFAEVVRRPGLIDDIQRNYRVTITSPTTLAVFLNSLQMGFKTLAIQKRSSQVWQLLGMVKNEFSKFGEILEKTKKKLQEATNSIDDASSKTRTIQTKLKNVQELPVHASGDEPVIESISVADSDS